MCIRRVSCEGREKGGDEKSPTDGTLMRGGVNDVLMARSAAKQAIQRLSGPTPTGSALWGLVASFFVFGGTVTSGCVAAAIAPPSRVVVVNGPPPAPVEEERPPQPHAAAVWVAGYWLWNGIQYAWIPGRWETAPRAGAIWQAPRYVKTEGAYVFEPGAWGAEGLPRQANAFR
jgi:hypothetical protein